MGYPRIIGWLGSLAFGLVACNGGGGGSATSDDASSDGDGTGPTTQSGTYATDDSGDGTGGPGDGSDDTADDTSSDDTATTDDPACQTALGSDPAPRFERPHGLFTLRVSPGYTGFGGHVTTSAPTEFHEETEREGQCRLLQFEATSCTPECLPPSVCIDEACVTPPALANVGDLVIEGVGDGPHAVADDGFHNYYWEQVGDPVIDMPRLVASGDEVPPFDLSVCPTNAPTPVDDWSALLAARADGESVTLTWSDPIPTARIYLRMTTGIGTHGGISPAEIECEGPDVGMLELPGAFLDTLYSDGWGCGECGGNDLIRYHGDQTEGDAPVQFRSAAVASFWHIPGLGGG